MIVRQVQVIGRALQLLPPIRQHGFQQFARLSLLPIHPFALPCGEVGVSQGGFRQAYRRLPPVCFIETVELPEQYAQRPGVGDDVGHVHRYDMVRIVYPQKTYRQQGRLT
jgi:hypothetical protein